MPVDIKVKCNPNRNCVSRISDAYNAKPETESNAPGHMDRLQKHNDLWRQIETDLDFIVQIAFEEGRKFQKDYPNINPPS